MTMELDTPLDLAHLRRRARRAYELGRLRAATLAALLVAGVGALLGTLLIGAEAARWAPLTFVLWVALGWRGGPLLRGARYGLLAGGLTLLLPLSLLRPCCRFDVTGMASCTMPEMCVALGALVGLPLSALVLSRSEPRASLHGKSPRLTLGLGMWLGVVSAATFKCSALFVGEAVGLLGGLALGMIAASLVSGLGARTSQA